MCTRVHTASTGARRPPWDPFEKCAGCSLSLMSKVLGVGAAGSPPGLRLPKAPKEEPLKLAEAFLAPAVAFRDLAYVAFSFSVGSIGVSNYIYFHELELCFI